MGRRNSRPTGTMRQSRVSIGPLLAGAGAGVSAATSSHASSSLRLNIERTESQKRLIRPLSSTGSSPVTLTGARVRVETGSQCSSVRVARRVWNTGSTFSTWA
ncbi:hypothetical protein G6F51_014531 [Rhizopus arrhizus]|uniref:Uncharacterized protein n=1 Tax=Rhizopus oryzae TaxID=64495 RepID=A0A9P6XM45_RHIOR|nr:hypothetical protein G6F51_014531 [Rhizopus arrhizus]